MRIAIIGGGITGLTAAHALAVRGHTVTVFEKEPVLGGLAAGFTRPGWAWHIEGAYHHLFTNDAAIVNLMTSLGMAADIIKQRPVTASLWHDTMYQLDSPMSLLRFPGLSLTDKLRTAVLLALLKLNPFWRPLEGITAERLLVAVGGKRAFTAVWEPLLYGKFGDFAPTVAASWFWARIKKRTPSLLYVRGGFHTFVEALDHAITGHGGTILTSTSVRSIRKTSDNACDVTWDHQTQPFDRVLITIPTPLALSLLPASVARDNRYALLRTIPHLSAQTLIVETDKPILNRVYWLNVTDRSFPFLAAVAHTNFMDPAHYGGRHLTYFGNYLPPDHPNLSMTNDQLLKTFLPFIKNLSHSEFRILNSYMFVAPFAQPVHQLHYAQKIPRIATPIPGIFMANMDYIYPWDRGTNYAVELGQRAARIMLSS